MRALGMLIATFMLSACVGGSGPLSTETDNGVPVDEQGGTGGGGNSRSAGSTTNNDNDSAEDAPPSSSSTSSGGTTDGAKCFEKCPKLTCTCGKFTATVQQCKPDGSCATTCAEAGCE